MASPFRVLELYSGIGGMHFALKESGILYQVIQAMDLNLNANKVYQHNFPGTRISGSSIGGLLVEDLNELQVDMMVMSPPCQPFTRMGNQKDEDDTRTGSFLHFLNIFKKINKHPSYLLLENVKGFESSNTRDKLIETLTECGYAYQELMLTPKQFGVPNCRLRYFLLAKLKPLTFGFKTTEEIMTKLPEVPKEWLPYRLQTNKEDSVSDHQDRLTCICQGYFRKNLFDGHNFKRPSDVINDINVKRFKQKSEGRKTVNGSDKDIQNITENCEFKSKASDNHNDSNVSRLEENSGNRNLLDDISASEKELQNCEFKAEPSNPYTNCKSELSNPNTESQYETSNLNTESECEPSNANTESKCGTSNLNRDCKSEPSSPNTDRKSEPSDPNMDHDRYIETKAISENSHVNCLQNYGQRLRLGPEDRDTTDGVCLKVRHFLESDWTYVEKFEKYLVPRKLFKLLVPMDIVNPCSRKTACFTKRYGKFVTGGGSLLLTTSDICAIESANKLKEQVMEKLNRDTWGERELDIIGELNMRYFTPREVANIMCFPKSFEFPEDCTDKQKYMLLGNSINVHVVAVLIKLLTF